MLDPARAVARLRDCLLAGGVAVIPTDTIYGIACDPLRERAVRRLYELKGRPGRQPSAVMFFALSAALAALPELGERERAALIALLPGPLTVLLPNRLGRYPLACAPAGPSAGSPPDAAAGTEAGAHAHACQEVALGLRVPALPGPLAELRQLELPVLQSSANLSGGPEARRLADVPAELLDDADLVVDGGELPGAASTILDLRGYERAGRWRVVREGPVGTDALLQALG
jgi:L-threonylcarbamoyladenylate synthase